MALKKFSPPSSSAIPRVSMSSEGNSVCCDVGDVLKVDFLEMKRSKCQMMSLPQSLSSFLGSASSCESLEHLEVVLNVCNASWYIRSSLFCFRDGTNVFLLVLMWWLNHLLISQYSDFYVSVAYGQIFKFLLLCRLSIKSISRRNMRSLCNSDSKVKVVNSSSRHQKNHKRSQKQKDSPLGSLVCVEENRIAPSLWMNK